MNTTPDVVLAAEREWIAATVLPKEDVASGWDVFTFVPSLEALIGEERDRIGYAQIVAGPAPKPGVRCRDILRVAFGFRYFNDFASQARMLRDITVLNERFRGSVAPNIDGLDRAKPADGGPSYDYSSLAKAVIVVFDVTLEYHVEV